MKEKINFKIVLPVVSLVAAPKFLLFEAFEFLMLLQESPCQHQEISESISPNQITLRKKIVII